MSYCDGELPNLLTEVRNPCKADTERCSNDTKYFAAALKVQCTAYRYAYDQEIQRGIQIQQAYQALFARYERIASDLAVMASQQRSLQKELDDMQTDLLAQDVVIRGYERRWECLLLLGQSEGGKDLDDLMARIKQPERERLDMQ